MTKSELIGQIAENAGISKSEADKAYDAVISAIISGLKKDFDNYKKELRDQYKIQLGALNKSVETKFQLDKRKAVDIINDILQGKKLMDGKKFEGLEKQINEIKTATILAALVCLFVNFIPCL